MVKTFKILTGQFHNNNMKLYMSRHGRRKSGSQVDRAQSRNFTEKKSIFSRSHLCKAKVQARQKENF